MNTILEQYRELLEKALEEKVYQKFLEQNTQFVPRHFVQNHGVHMSLVLRKLKISNDMITDFVILSKSSIAWNYILIEIEKPSSNFFKRGTTKAHSDFIRGITQIKSWQAWFDNPANKAHFEAQLRFLKKPISDAPVNIKYVLVTGRRKEFEASEAKMRAIGSFESDDFKIMSFDSLSENAHNNGELYLGLRKQGAIELVSDRVLDTEFLYWCDDSDFQLSQRLKESFILHLDARKRSLESTRLGKQG